MSNAKVAKLLVLSVEELKRNLHYNPDTGVFTRVASNHPKVKIGDIAGSIRNGYVVIKINVIAYNAHRLAWLYMTGAMPKEFIDHINGDRSDNRFCNLREATNAQNVQNEKTLRKNNTTGFAGVILNKRKKDKRYCAQIKINRKNVALGCFECPKEAHQAYLEAKRKFHEFCTI